MKKVFWLSLIIISLGVVLLFIAPHQSPPKPSSAIRPSAKAEKDKGIRSEFRTIGRSAVYTLLIPSGSRFSVTPALSSEVNTVGSLAQKYQALAAINGGFFDPQNQKSTSYVVQNGKLVADPHLNERLVDNPDNTPYLKKIFDRTEFRRLQCGPAMRYDIVLHSAPSPSGCQLVDALGGGPSLLPLTLVQEGFLDFDNGKVIRDPLGSRQPNARTAVGITHEGSILLIMIAQNPLSPTASGMSLIELAAFLKSQGVEKAMNLDGGSSSSFYYKGKTIYGKVDANGHPVRRLIKSVLLVQEKGQ